MVILSDVLLIISVKQHENFENVLINFNLYIRIRFIGKNDGKNLYTDTNYFLFGGAYESRR